MISAINVLFNSIISGQTTVTVTGINASEQVNILASGFLTTSHLLCPQPQWYSASLITSSGITTATAIINDFVVDALLTTPQLIAFSLYHPPTIKTGFNWNSSLPVSVTVSSPVTLTISFNMVTAKTSQIGLLAATANALASFINEHSGISNISTSFPSYGNPVRNRYKNFSGTQEDAQLLYKDRHDLNPNTLNVYVVDTILTNQYEGYMYFVSNSAGKTVPIIIITYYAPGTTLVHEIGHAFRLAHIDIDYRIPSYKTGFNNENIMYSRSLSRGQYVTEGQIFRAYFSDFTFLQILNPGWVAPSSMSDEGGQYYPPLAKRLYWDGTLAP